MQVHITVDHNTPPASLHLLSRALLALADGVPAPVSPQIPLALPPQPSACTSVVNNATSVREITAGGLPEGEDEGSETGETGVDGKPKRHRRTKAQIAADNAAAEAAKSGAGAPAASTPTQPEAAPAAPATQAAANPADAPVATRADALAAVEKLSQVKSTEVAMNAIREFSPTGRISGIAEADYGKFVAHCKTVGEFE